jgi:hypothetical protein
VFGESQILTGLLSGSHLIGLTLIVGGALVTGLRLMGVIMPGTPVADVVAAPIRGMTVGLAISVASGLLMFAPRASAAAGNGFFQLKMSLLVAAACFHFAVIRRLSRVDASPRLLQGIGAVGFALWFSVAVAGCAFIFLE